MTTKEKIIKTIDEIPAARHRELFELIEQFKNKTSRPGKSKWTEYAGILSDEDARIMKSAIADEFEKVEDEK